MIAGRYGILPVGAGMQGQMFTMAHHPMVRGRYRDLATAKRLADQQRAQVYDLVANRIVYVSNGAEEAFETGRFGLIGRARNKADRAVDNVESKTHGRGTGYRAPRRAW